MDPARAAASARLMPGPGSTGDASGGASRARTMSPSVTRRDYTRFRRGARHAGCARLRRLRLAWIQAIGVVQVLHAAIRVDPGGPVAEVHRQLPLEGDPALAARGHRLLDSGFGPFGLVAQD